MSTKEVYDLYVETKKDGYAVVIAISYLHPEMDIEEIQQLLEDTMFEYEQS